MTDPPGGGVLLGIWLRHQRVAAGLTQEDLAQRPGMSTRAISDLERGRTRRPYRRSLRLVAGALGLTESAGDELVARYRRSPALGPRTVPARRKKRHQPALNSGVAAGANWCLGSCRLRSRISLVAPRS